MLFYPKKEGGKAERKRAESVGQQKAYTPPKLQKILQNSQTLGVNGLFVELSEGRKTKRSQLTSEFLLKASSPLLTFSSFGGVGDINK